jgi:hypothetical protein
VPSSRYLPRPSGASKHSSIDPSQPSGASKRSSIDPSRPATTCEPSSKISLDAAGAFRQPSRVSLDASTTSARRSRVLPAGLRGACRALPSLVQHRVALTQRGGEVARGLAEEFAGFGRVAERLAGSPESELAAPRPGRVRRIAAEALGHRKRRARMLRHDTSCVRARRSTAPRTSAGSMSSSDWPKGAPGSRCKRRPPD